MAAHIRVSRARSGAIRVVLPAEVAFNMDRFQASLKNLAERLGHPACISGQDFRFDMERYFAVNPATLKVEAQPEPFVIAEEVTEGL